MALPGLNLAHGTIHTDGMTNHSPNGMFTNEQKLINLMGQNYVAIGLLYGKDLIVQDANERMCYLWGRLQTDVIGKKLLDAVPELIGQGFDDLIHEVMDTGRPYEALATPAVLKRPVDEALETRYFDFSYLPITVNEATLGVMIISIDVTSEVEAKAAVDVATLENVVISNRLIEIFEHAPAMVAVLRGPNHIFEMANAMYRDIAMGGREAVGRSVAQAIPEVVGQGFIDLLDSVYITGKPFIGLESKVELDRKGTGELETVYINLLYQATRDGDGVIDGIFVHAVEITEQVLARQDLEAALTRLAMSQEAANIGSFEVDLATGELQGTSKLAELFGLPYDKLADAYRNQPKRINEEDFPHVSKTLDRAKHAHDSFSLEYRVLWPDGSNHWVQARGQFEYDENNQAKRLVGVVLDIAERKVLERQKDDFIAIASHELKTPVTSIKAYAQTMERRFVRNKQPQEAANMQRINVQLDKLTSLIGDLLDVTKVDTGKLELHFTQFDFDELVAEVAEQAQLTTDHHTITINAASRAVITGDRDRIGQVLTNLLSNAIKYSPQAPSIEVKTGRDGDAVTACVADHGIGIDPARREAVFERFFRVSGPDMHSFPGLGLGLYISSEIVKRLGGRIWVESEVGQGATFCVSLPTDQRSAVYHG